MSVRQFYKKAENACRMQLANAQFSAEACIAGFAWHCRAVSTPCDCAILTFATALLCVAHCNFQHACCKGGHDAEAERHLTHQQGLRQTLMPELTGGASGESTVTLAMHCWGWGCVCGAGQ